MLSKAWWWGVGGPPWWWWWWWGLGGLGWCEGRQRNARDATGSCCCLNATAQHRQPANQLNSVVLLNTSCLWPASGC
jgi:hypothetical protein